MNDIPLPPSSLETAVTEIALPDDAQEVAAPANSERLMRHGALCLMAAAALLTAGAYLMWDGEKGVKSGATSSAGNIKQNLADTANNTALDMSNTAAMDVRAISQSIGLQDDLQRVSGVFAQLRHLRDLVPQTLSRVIRST